MKTFENFQSFLDRMVNASTEQEKINIKNEFDSFFASLDAKEKKDFTKFQISVAEKVKLEMLDIIQDSKNTITVEGKSYPLSVWVTSKTYCKINNVKESTISNQIRRKSIPNDVYVVIPELNDMKLIRKDYLFRG